jgi:hypothetical protein
MPPATSATPMKAASDAGWSLLLGSGFELFVGKQLHRTDGDEGERQGASNDP